MTRRSFRVYPPGPMAKRKASSDSDASLSDGGAASSGEEEAYKPPKKAAKKAAGGPGPGAAPAAAAGGRGAGRGAGAKKAADAVRAEVDEELDAPPPEPGAGGAAAGGASDDDRDDDEERDAADDAEFDDRHRHMRETEAKRMQYAPKTRRFRSCPRVVLPLCPSLTRVPRRQILASFTPAQLDRYESFRRSFLNRKAIKKLALAATGGPPPTLPTLIVLGGLGKHFCGELVEEGRRVMADRGEAGPLRPVHVQEAHRRLAARGACCHGFELVICALTPVSHAQAR